MLGLDTALVKYGTMSRSAVMASAIRLARDGFALTDADADILAMGAPRLRHDPVAARIFLRPDGSSLRAGDRLVQPELAATLQSIAEHGADNMAVALQGGLRPPPAPGDPFVLEGAGFQAVVKAPRPAESGGEPTESK